MYWVSPGYITPNHTSPVVIWLKGEKCFKTAVYDEGIWWAYDIWIKTKLVSIDQENIYKWANITLVEME